MTLNDIKARCDEVGECWIWKCGTDGHGRPVMAVNRRSTGVRRYVRGLVDGEPVPKGKVAAAKCGDLLCVSPHCSVVATQKQKARMASERGAYFNPSRDAKVALRRRAASKISEQQIEAIRSEKGSGAEIAAKHNLSKSHVLAIRRGAARAPLRNPFAGLGAR